MKRRLPWLILVLVVVMIATGRYYEYRGGSIPEDGYRADSLLGIAFLLFPMVGALILSRTRGNRVGWILLLIGFLVAALVWGMGYSAYQVSVGAEPHPLWVLAAWFEAWAWLPLIMTIPTLLFLLFPDGRVPSPRWRWVARAAVVLIVVLSVPSMLVDRLAERRLDNPIGIPGLKNPEGALGPLWVVFLGVMIACAASLFFRYRRADVEQRQQLKWFAVAAALLVTGMVVGEAVVELPEELFPFVLMLVPASIGVAVLKYRLYDIDVVINRTLVYGALTAILVGCYLALVFVFQAALSGVTQESDLAVAASTLAAAAMFRPLRARLQSFIDRRFYRRKYDAQHTLETFSSRLRDEVDLEHLANDLSGVVRETMQPAHVSVWLRGART